MLFAASQTVWRAIAVRGQTASCSVWQDDARSDRVSSWKRVRRKKHTSFEIDICPTGPSVEIAVLAQH